MNTMHEITHFSSVNAGPHLLVFGAIHGNEACGAHATRKAIKLFQSGQWNLNCGTITFLPVCNPDAFKEGVREVSVNLNRVIKKHDNPQNYEEGLASSIAHLIERCDYLLDIHSYHTDGSPFVFQDYEDDKTKSFARSLGVNHIIRGWNQMFATVSDDEVSDTVTFAHTLGKIGAVIECGNHDNPENTSVALTAIKNALGHLMMIDEECPTRAVDECSVITGRKVVYKNKAGALTKNWKNLDYIKEGECIATYDDGSEELAPHSGVIILPYPEAKLGDEWFYYGDPS